MKITLAHVRDFMNQWDRGEMSFSMMAHKLNEVSQDNWISVKDRLSEEQGHFLVIAPQSFPKNCIMVVAEFYDDNDTFYSESSDCPMPDVTHWMPLPEPPQE